MTNDDKQKAARKVNRAADDLEEAADMLDNAAQANHVDDMAEEARKTGRVLDDQARNEE